MATYTSGTMTTSNTRVNYRIVVTTSSQSIDENSTTMNVKVQAWRNNTGYTTSGSGTCYCRIQGTLYSAAISTSQKITHNSDTVLFDKDITVAHNNDGSCTLKLSAYINHYAFSTSEQSYSVALPTIPRASVPTLSKTDFNIGDEITINTNRVSSNFKHNVYFIRTDGSYETIATGVESSYTWKTGDAFYAQCPNDKEFSSTLLVKTYNSGTYIGGKTISFCAHVTDVCRPTCEGISYTQTDETVSSLVGNNSDIILDKSKILVTFSGAEAKNYASIKKYYVQIENKIFESDSSEFYITNIPEAEAIYGWVKDSRGLDSSAAKVSAQLGRIYDYSAPTVNNIQLIRQNDIEKVTYLSFDASVADIIASNSSYYISLRSKEANSSAWGEPTYIINRDRQESNYSYNSEIGEFAIDKNYSFEIVIGDSFGEYTYNAFLQTSKPELSIRNNMVGINCVPTDDNGTLQIDGKNLLDLIHPVLSEDGSTKIDLKYNADSTNPQSGMAVAEAIKNKVDKVSGKGLSTNDFTDEYAQKLNQTLTAAAINDIVDNKVLNHNNSGEAHTDIRAMITSLDTLKASVEYVDSLKTQYDNLNLAVGGMFEFKPSSLIFCSGNGKNLTLRKWNGVAYETLVENSPTIICICSAVKKYEETGAEKWEALFIYQTEKSYGLLTLPNMVVGATTIVPKYSNTLTVTNTGNENTNNAYIFYQHTGE